MAKKRAKDAPSSTGTFSPPGDWLPLATAFARLWEYLHSSDLAEQELYEALSSGRLSASEWRKGAKVALVTSRMGSIDDNSSGGAYGYRMSKAALNMAGKSLAVDLRARGVAVAILHPGMVKTDMIGGNGQVEPADAAKGLLARIDDLTLATSGAFWHMNGERLPW